MFYKQQVLLLAGLLCVGGSALAADCSSVDAYVDGASYETGDQVAHLGNLYQCDVAGWCSTGGPYEPEQGWAWGNAWTLVDSCDGDTGSGTGGDNGGSTGGDTSGGAGGDTGGSTGGDAGGSTGNDPVATDPVIEACRPEGLYSTPGVDSPYCSVYDENGREELGANHSRRIIGYFTAWRTGGNGQAQYLVNDIPWDKMTHINYAFAHVSSDYKLSIGDPNAEGNAATNMTWPGVSGAQMDPEFPYTGHFNLLNKFKKQYPQVKTLVSVGGWAETGGHFDENGNRVADGGFYTMTTNADNSINQQGIETFANSAVEFIRTYGFDGVDIDYEYSTTMNDAGNPLDFEISNARRAGLMASYIELMKTLREKLDQAGAEDGQHYLLTIASPSSAFLLRGMESMQVLRYLDYVNIMTYDLHGAWNQFVGHNAPLYDTGEDRELQAWNFYSSQQFQQIGYLNTDWAFHYMKGAMEAGRINIGLPFYTRGWQGVTGGANGLWGTASLPDQSNCPDGTGAGQVNDCGYGAMGIDNLWHDKDPVTGEELGAGSNPMWHAKNLEEGIVPSYLSAYGLGGITQLEGDYQRYLDEVARAAWLWNADKQVFLSIEDKPVVAEKAEYVIDNGIGGVMFWELAGDYAWDAGQGEYVQGDTLVTTLFDAFSNAPAYENTRWAGSVATRPDKTVDLRYEIGDFPLGDNNFPITPALTLTNNTGVTLPGGTVIEFDVPTAIPDNISDQSGAGLTVISNGSNAAGNNVGGLNSDYHRVQISTPAWKDLADGASLEVALSYQLPMPLPTNWTVELDGTRYALRQDHPELPVADLSAGAGNDSGNTGDGTGGGTDPVACSGLTVWDASSAYTGGAQVQFDGNQYEANWWTQGDNPAENSGAWSVWTLLGACQ